MGFGGNSNFGPKLNKGVPLYFWPSAGQKTVRADPDRLRWSENLSNLLEPQEIDSNWLNGPADFTWKVVQHHLRECCFFPRPWLRQPKSRNHFGDEDREGESPNETDIAQKVPPRDFRMIANSPECPPSKKAATPNQHQHQHHPPKKTQPTKPPPRPTQKKIGQGKEKRLQEQCLGWGTRSGD